MRRGTRFAFGFAAAGLGLAAVVATSGLLAKPLALPTTPEAITVAARPIAGFRTGEDKHRFGALDFRGGLVLTSDFSGFGGISGFSLAEDGRFLAITDAGLFLSGRLDTDGDRPTGLSDVQAVALLDSQGRVQAARGRPDVEAVTIAPDAVYVAMETVNEVWRYPPDPLGQKGTQVPAPAIRDLRRNAGLESLVFVSSGPLRGALLAIGEEGATQAEDLPGFILGGRQPGSFTVVKSGPFDATDLALGPDGDLFLLERHYSPLTGVLLQIRRFALADVKPGARLEGEVLGTFDMGYEIDNMEGLAVTRSAAGETLLTMVSDDNFSMIQRTLLLRFAVVRD
ncbi:esterase-like activity of phytase family protein [Xanthobacter autotrophicus]|uniref:esterase-like activity of phytase family protein n=1 Tax=Xanthobacter autotrophicus TaxID=280 RepID=UPI0024A6BFAA|nr:esterase-like activity of phytase family protein [Xanthobacter autotrophicus]MDI4657261.1 esterase-like activity of phytase family protein [Xanthobacter autotrophicus]